MAATRDASGKFASTTPQTAVPSVASSSRSFIPNLPVIRYVPKIGLNKNTLILAGAVLIALGGSGYFYQQYRNSQNELEDIKADPSLIAKQEAKDLVEKVGSLVSLPEGEEPTVATVTDVNKLKNQAFFANAENGDKVLIYTQAKKAYLYRPSINKVLEIAPINIGTSQTPSTNSSK